MKALPLLQGASIASAGELADHITPAVFYFRQFTMISDEKVSEILEVRDQFV